MYLHQKLKYKYKRLDNDAQVLASLNTGYPINYIGWDTETTGLNIITDKPFLMSYGWSTPEGNNCVFVVPYTKEVGNVLFNYCDTHNIPMFAHNAKYDYHMVQNGGSPIPDTVKLYDSITVARLTENADERESMSLEALGTKYIDDEAKFAGHIIKDIIHKIDRERRERLRKGLMEEFPNDGFKTITKDGKVKGTGKLTALIDDYEKTRTKWVNDDNPYFQYIDKHFQRANYRDVWDKECALMENYAADDIVIMLEYLKKALPVLKEVDKDFRVLKREGELIKAVAWMENTGFKVDIDYILESRKKIVAYRELLYLELSIYTGKEFSVGQHNEIKKLLLNKFKVKTEKADEKALKYIIDNTEDEILISVCKNILELRTLDKWLSTYIDGKLNAVTNGRIYTDINNNGAVSGRVSCDMQQQPKDGLYDRDGNELFHPRRAFICDEGYKLFFIDESQMELRVQAQYTIFHSKEPDLNLCRAYMPYKCYNEVSTVFDYNNPNHLKHFTEKKWYECGTGKEWKPTDLHSETTKHAFPDLDPTSDEFKKKRKLGKRCNLLKVYQGGVQALKESLDVSEEIAQALDDAFYKAFPRIKDYQDWVNEQLTAYGYIENLYGRRYYMEDSRQFYKGCNYLIQGTCADMVKTFEIKIWKYITENNLGIKMVLPIHDELIFLVPKGKEKYVKELKHIMEDTLDVIKNIPMIAEVEMSETSWRDKKGYEFNE
jgi:DNA polymerase-1